MAIRWTLCLPGVSLALFAVEELFMKVPFGFSKVVVPLLIPCVLIVGMCLPIAALGQRPKTKAEAAGQNKKDDAAPKKAGAKKTDDEEKTKPQPVDRETDDGMLIGGTYFPSKLGKSAPVIVLMHGYGEKQRVFDDLAFFL